MRIIYLNLILTANKCSKRSACVTSTRSSPHIPAEYRLKRDLKVPRQMGESEIVDYFRDRASEMVAGYGIMLGAGCTTTIVRSSSIGGLTRRVSYFLHALSGGDHARNAAGDL